MADAISPHAPLSVSGTVVLAQQCSGYSRLMRQSASAQQVRVLGNIQTNRQQDSYPVEPPISWRVLGDSSTRAELDNKVQNSRA